MKKKLYYWISLISLFFILLGLSVYLGINSRFVYYFDVGYLDIVSFSGYSKEIVLKNYNILVDYLSPFYFGKLNLYQIPMSSSGEKHFKEVKDLVNLFYYFGFFFLIVFIINQIVFYKEQFKNKHKYLKDVSISYLIIIGIIFIFSLIDFYTLFIIFHYIAFRNDDWMFDAVDDPVIYILPEEFFMHAAISICVYLIISLLICYLLYKYYFKHKDKTLK